MTVLSLAAPVGLATGLLAWLAAGGASADVERLDKIAAELGGLRAPKASARAGRFQYGADLRAQPIFALTTGTAALREPALRLDGVSISSRRTAALVSIDGKSAEWMSVGGSRDGVTLQDLSASVATFETAVGSKQLALGEQSAASAPAQAQPAPVTAGQTIVDQMPPGFRSPPPPASAPPTKP